MSTSHSPTHSFTCPKHAPIILVTLASRTPFASLSLQFSVASIFQPIRYHTRSIRSVLLVAPDRIFLVSQNRLPKSLQTIRAGVCLGLSFELPRNTLLSPTLHALDILASILIYISQFLHLTALANPQLSNISHSLTRIYNNRQDD